MSDSGSGFYSSNYGQYPSITFRANDQSGPGFGYFIRDIVVPTLESGATYNAQGYVTSGTFDYELPFNQWAQPATIWMSGILVTDVARNTFAINDNIAAVAALGFPTSFALIDSATEDTSVGLFGGEVVIHSPPGTSITSSVNPVSGNQLSDGASVLVGELAYTVTGLSSGASISVIMTLPSGSNPNAVYKVINGAYVDMSSSSTFSGDTITMHITDGGVGDEDNLANGVIVDPVIPVHRVVPTSPVITSRQTTSFTKGKLGSFRIVATGNPAPTFAIAAGVLPTGLSLNTTTGVISGTPTTAGIFNVTVSASNGVGTAAAQLFTMSVQGVSILTTQLPNARVGQKYRVQVSASSPLPVTWKFVTGSAHPTWLKLSSSGVLSGSPLRKNSFTLKISASDGTHTATKTLTLVVR